MKLEHKQTRWQRLLYWLLMNGPLFVAHWLAEKAAKLDHSPDGAWCWPCAARDRLADDKHRDVVGPSAIVYCTKCGLDRDKQRQPFCSNRVEKVNNRPPKRSPFELVGW